MPKGKSRARASMRGRSGYPCTDRMSERELTYWSIMCAKSDDLDTRVERLPTRQIDGYLARNILLSAYRKRAKAYVHRLTTTCLLVYSVNHQTSRDRCPRCKQPKESCECR